MNCRKETGMLVLLAMLVMHSYSIVAQVPTIIEGPADKTVSPGATVEFKCIIIDKTNEYVVSWIQDDRRISRSNNESLDNQHVDITRYSLIGNVEGDYSLQIRDVKSADASQLKCTIARQNTVVAQSDVAVLDVQYAPDEESFTCLPGDFTDLQVNSPITFQCSSDEGNPSATLQWSVDSEPVNATLVSNPVSLILSFTKIISIEDDQKVYRCDIVHPLLTRPRPCRVGPLSVIYKPIDVTITPDSPNAVVSAGQRLYLKCTARANPEMNYSWTITPAPGRTLDRMYYAPQNVLILWDATPSFHGATATCTVNNTVGKSSASIRISVIGVVATRPATPNVIATTGGRSTISSLNSDSGTLTTFHITIIVIAIAFVTIVAILGYIALCRRREPPIQLHVAGGAEDTRSLGEASIIFHSRHNTPDPERGTLGRMTSNFSTMSYDTQSIDSATQLMHLKSLESPEYKVNPKLTGSPTRKLKGGKEYVDEHAKLDSSPFHRVEIIDNTYEGSPKRVPPTSTPKSTITRQPSEHTYDECTLMSQKKYTTHASQTDLTIIGKSIDEEIDDHDFDEDDDDGDVMCHPHVSNFSVNNCNISSRKHTQV